MASLARRLAPLMDRVLVEKVQPPQKTAGGVFLPEQVTSKTNEGTVLAVGPGRLNVHGERLPMSVKEGDKVLLPEYGGQQVTVQDRECYIYRDEDLLGIVYD